MATTRDIRTVNMSEGQKIESDLVVKRIGDLSFRNFGSLMKMSLFDSGKTIIVGDGLRVIPVSGMTVKVGSGGIAQRVITNGNINACLQVTDQTVTLDAASGSPRIDIIEGKITAVSDKDDTTQVATVASGSSVSITNETIKRDIKYYLSCRKKTGSTTPTAATIGTLTGTVPISGTIDLSEKYLMNVSYGEDGSYQEIDLRGSTPEATTPAEIIANINAAVGATAVSVGSGDVLVMVGEGSGESSYFEIKPPVTDSDKDALEEVFGVSIGGVYRYIYQGVNEWIKLAEFDIGSSTTTISADLIRDVDKKSTWASEGDTTMVHEYIYQPNSVEWNKYDANTSYSLNDIVWVGDEQFVSLVNSNLNNDPILSPNSWGACPNWHEVIRMFNEGIPVQSGLKDIDTSTGSGYDNWRRLGYYNIKGVKYEAFKVYMDGSVVTGDAELVSILDVGGSQQYWNIDTIAPDSLGTRTLRDYKGAYARSFSNGVTSAIGVRQLDQMQLLEGSFGHSGAGADAEGKLASGAGAVTGVFSVGGTTSSTLVAYADNAQTGYRSIVFSSANSPNARTSATTAGETRGVNYTVGIPWVVILKQVA